MKPKQRSYILSVHTMASDNSELVKLFHETAAAVFSTLQCGDISKYSEHGLLWRRRYINVTFLCYTIDLQEANRMISFTQYKMSRQFVSWQINPLIGDPYPL